MQNFDSSQTFLKVINLIFGVTYTIPFDDN